MHARFLVCVCFKDVFAFIHAVSTRVHRKLAGAATVVEWVKLLFGTPASHTRVMV